MTAPQLDEVIHQAFFGFSRDNNEHTLIAGSLDRPNETRWRAKLTDHVRLHPVSGAELPKDALSYLTFKDGSAAVMRRFDLSHLEGRGNAHVLIGSTATLNVSLALGLADWDGWQGDVQENTWMGTITVPFLANAAGHAKPPPSQLARLEAQLVMVLARLLEKSADPVSIIGCPNKDRLAIVWALHAAADDYLVRQLRRKRRWSYSTYEDRHEDSIDNLPEIVFLPAKPLGGVASRTIVDLDREPISSSSTNIAHQLIARLIRGEPIPSGVDDSVPADFQSHSSEREHKEVRTPIGHRRKDRDATSVKPLLSARTAQEFLARLNELKGESSDRHRLRDTLDVRAIDTVTQFVEINARHELLQEFLQVVYGPTYEDLDLAEAGKHAARIVANCQSEQLAKMLGANASVNGKPEIVAAAVSRWSADGRRPRPVPTSRAAQTLRRMRGSWRLPVVAMVAVLALLTIVFLLGFLAGRPALVQQPAAAPRSESTAPSLTQAPPIPTQTVGGTVHMSPPGANYQVFAFVSVGDSHYPQAPCRSQDETGTAWKCEKLGNPPEKPGVPPVLMAILVPQAQVNNLIAKAAAGNAVERSKDWGRSIQVPLP